MRWFIWGAFVVAGEALAAPTDLVHQGRIVGPSGGPLNGAFDLTLTLYGAGDVVLDTVVVDDVPVEDGYYSVRFPTGADFAGTTDFQVGVRVDGGPEMVRQTLGSVPRAHYAVAAGTATTATTATRVGVSNTLLTGTCPATGTVMWDSAADAIRVCDDTLAWTAVGTTGPKTIVLTSGARRWSDGTFAANCNAYRNPTFGFSYAGDVGNGVYVISTVVGDSFNVYCDMTYDGGGWTKVMAYGPTGATDMGGTAAINRNGTWTTDGRGTAVGRVSNAEWTVLRGAGTEFMMRVQNPTDSKFIGNGVGFLKWTALGGTTWPVWGTSYRPTNWRFDCDKTGDGTTDQSLTQTTSGAGNACYGSYWIEDHHPGVQCFGGNSVFFQTNIHFCGTSDGTQSGGDVRGTHSIYLRN